MICFNCGNVLTNSDYCSHCGMDVSIYKKIVKLSNTYYNMGLTKALNRDLSGAADALRRSVKLNKRNTDARNLLGLVYFEMGETVQAFSEWVMSMNLQPDNNAADKYMAAIQADKGKIDELNHTIKKFNIALEYAKDGTDDMAIIQLKKVLNQNPNLIKGYQLLAVLYMKHGEYERARKATKKALKIDKCNPLCVRYLREITNYLEDEKKNNPERRRKRRMDLRGTMIDRPYLSGDDVIIPKNNFKEATSSAQSIIHIVMGVLLGAALVFFIVTPARVSTVSDQISQVKVDYNQKIAIKDSSISELQKSVDTLTAEKEDLAARLGEYTDTDNTLSKNYTQLLSAVASYLKSDYDASAKSILKVDTSLEMNSSAFTEVYNTLNSKIASRVAETSYDAGMEALNKKDYSMAITNFLKAIEADSNNDDAYYYLAWSYKNNGDEKNAKKYFKEIVDKFPNSKNYTTAKTQAGVDDTTTSSDETTTSEE